MKSDIFVFIVEELRGSESIASDDYTQIGNNMVVTQQVLILESELTSYSIQW